MQERVDLQAVVFDDNVRARIGGARRGRAEAASVVLPAGDGKAARGWEVSAQASPLLQFVGRLSFRSAEPCHREPLPARERFRPRTFRLYVTEWNARAIALYERLGFREVGERHVRTFERFGDHVFLRMERPA